jgi:gliding motility-associated-like protein
MLKLSPSRAPQSLMLALILLVSFEANAQQSLYDTKNWRFLNPTPMGFTFFDVDFVDNNQVLAVGAEGGIARSVNGGVSWNYGVFTFQTSAGLTTRPTIYDVHAVNNQTAYAVGNLGMMAKTTDGGVNWTFVRTPLYAKGRTINTVWFTSPTTGYIGGQHNTPDSLPKVYVTRDGGNTWDSIAAPTGPMSRIGYVNNSRVGSSLVPVTAKDKEILRIKFINDTIGYVSGSGLSTYLPIPNVNSTTGIPTGTNTSTGAHHASLLWKFASGRLIDYSTTKERVGYGGVTASPVTVSTRWGTPSLQVTTQSYRAMHIENDSTVLIMSFNNNIVLQIKTGRNDSTSNPATGGKDAGVYEVLNYPFPPLNAPSIPNPQTLLASNPYQIIKSPTGKLMAPGNFGRLATSIDGGKNWVMESSLPQGQNYSGNGTWAVDMSPAGKFLVMGTQGVMADSVTGGKWQSTYVSEPIAATHLKLEFADCNTAIATGGGSVTVTTDGGKTWINRARQDFASLNISITGMTFPAANRAYFTTNAGTIYMSGDLGQTMDPVFTDFNFQMNDVAAVGQDSLWAVAYSSFSVASANRTSAIFRSIDKGATWQKLGSFPVGTTAPNLSRIAFPTRTTGYVAGSRGGIYKTTDGGVTWTNISPAAYAGSTSMSYTEIQALDANTVFVIGNAFPNKLVYRTTDGGATWTNVSGNIDALGTGNLVGLMMHDVNNGYISTGAQLLITNNGGTSWTVNVSPSSSIFETIAFQPRSVPAGTPFNRRKLITTGFTVPGSSGQILEFGDTTLVNLNATVAATAATCANPTAGTITVTITGGVGPFTFSLDGTTFQASNVFTGVTRGDKTVTIREGICGKTITRAVTVPFTDNLTLTGPKDTTVCVGASFTLRASSNSSATTYAWTPATGLGSPTAAVTTATVSANTTFTVTATLNGCVKTASAIVTARPNPTVNAGPDQTIMVGEEVMLSGTSSILPRTITWAPAMNVTNPNILVTPARPSQTTNYTLTVVEANTGCSASDNMTVTVIPYCVKAMNAFTPNGDGINDRWLLTTSDQCTRNITVNVYNRYGHLVYSNPNYTNTWEGTINGKPLPDGTYYYSVKYTLINGRIIEQKGDVTILR